jgi:hypothetical protein
MHVVPVLFGLLEEAREGIGVAEWPQDEERARARSFEQARTGVWWRSGNS